MWRHALLGLALAGCTQFPELDETIEPAADTAAFPDLIPLADILAAEASRLEAVQDPEETDEEIATEEVIRARREALRRRAETLRGGVIDPQTQTRMQRGVAGG